MRELIYKPQELKWFKLFGWYQIIGGAIGIVIMLWAFVQATGISTGIAAFVGLLLNGYSIYAGNQLVTHSKFIPTYLIQGVQILNFIGLGIRYQVVIGLAVGVGFEWIENLELVSNLKLMSYLVLKYSASQTDKIRVVINFVPVLIINYLMKHQEQATNRM